MSKKLHAKDLKRDELVETLGELWGPAVHWFEENKKTLLWAGIAVLAVALGIGALGSVREAGERSAQAALGEALATLNEAESAAAGEGTEGPSWDEVRSAFATVAAEHGGTPGAVARHYAGVAQMRSGDAAGAVATLTEAVSQASDDWQKGLSLAVLAAAQEKSGDSAAAEATLQELRSSAGLGYPADAATMDLARFYERQGRLDEARSLYGELAPAEEPAEDEIPSVYAGQAQARLDELEG